MIYQYKDIFIFLIIYLFSGRHLSLFGYTYIRMFVSHFPSSVASLPLCAVSLQDVGDYGSP